MTVISAFDRASHSYDGSADLQTAVAARLIASAAVENPRTILDIGCGTGILTALAQRRWPKAAITAVDAAPAMIAVARAKLPEVRFVEANAAELRLPETFDVVLSSMVLHWLAEPLTVLAQWRNLVAPGGTLLTAFPVAGSLDEWNDLCASHEVQSRVWQFPSATVFGDGVKLHRHTVSYSSAGGFLRSMKSTGAAISDPITRPMPAGALRRVLASAPKPFAATFTIATVAETKTGPHF